MSASANNVVRLVPGRSFNSASVKEVQDLHTLQAQLQVLKRIYFAEAVHFDSISLALTQVDPGLTGHAFLRQIERLEAGIVALAEAAQAHHRAH